MNWNDLLSTFIFDSMASPWMQFAFFAVVLVVISFVLKFSDIEVILAGIFICMGWMPLSMLMSLWAEVYWIYLLNWVAATLCFFAFFFLFVSAWERYGRRHQGDRAIIMLGILPIYLFPITLIGSMVLRTIIFLTQWALEKYTFF